MKEMFRKISARIASATGTASAFLIALSVVIVWALTGPMFNYSDTWQLVINTGTTVVTFLMVFLIQNTQNRDSKAMHLKIDELIRSSKAARDAFVDLEDLTDKELAILDLEFKDIHNKLSGAKVVHGLHSRIAAEKERRISLHGSLQDAGTAIKSFLASPLSYPDSDSKDSTKKSSSTKR